MLRLLLILVCACAASAGHALPFDVSRESVRAAAQGADEDDLGPAEFDISPPWGLWGNRAPYPFYEGPHGIDSKDDLVARDIWFDFHSELWLAPNSYRGASGQMRARIGLFFADVSFTQIARTDRHDFIGRRKLRDWSYITDARGHLGFTWPIPKLGYVDLGVGVVGFDQSRRDGLSRAGISLKASASVWPVWPVGLEGWFSRAQFFDNTGVNDWGARVHLQVFRHVFVTVGWRWMNVDGNDFTTQGVTFGFSLQWSNLRTLFWAPFRGPAY
jgi:hypothetical protein